MKRHLPASSLTDSCCFFAGAQPAQLHQGGRGLCVARERGALLPADARVPGALGHAHQPRGQAADQEHHLPRHQGLGVGAGARQERLLRRALAHLRIAQRQGRQGLKTPTTTTTTTTNGPLIRFEFCAMCRSCGPAKDLMCVCALGRVKIE